MRVVIDRDLPADDVVIYVRGVEHALVMQDGQPTWIPQLERAVTPAFLRLKTQLWEDILREALRTGGAPEPDALADARAVRDRNLALVEKLVDGLIGGQP